MGDWLPSALESASYVVTIVTVLAAGGGLLCRKYRRRARASRKRALEVREEKLKQAKDSDRAAKRLREELDLLQAKHDDSMRKNTITETVDDVPDGEPVPPDQNAGVDAVPATVEKTEDDLRHEMGRHEWAAIDHMRDGLWCLAEWAGGQDGDRRLPGLPPFIEHITDLGNLASLAENAKRVGRDTLTRKAGDAVLLLLHEQRATGADLELRGRLRGRRSLGGDPAGGTAGSSLRCASVVRAEQHREDKEYVTSLGLLADALGSLPDDTQLWTEVSELAIKALWRGVVGAEFPPDPNAPHTDTRQQADSHANTHIIQPE